MKNKSIARLSLRKLLLSALVAAPLATLPAPLWALPASANLAAQVASTSAGVTFNMPNATTLDVTSTQNTSVIRWNDFGGGAMTIASGDTINFNQPSATSSLLNRVVGTNPTLIDGTLKSNGILYVMNPNGITVSTTGVINAAAVGLTTVLENDLTFEGTGSLTFPTTATPTGDIAVQGAASIQAASGSGNVWIVGQDIALAGTVAGGNVLVRSLNNGNVLLGAGAALTVGASATPVANLQVSTQGTGTITFAQTNNVVVNGPTVSLTTGNAAINQGSGYLQIGNTTGTLTTASGTADTVISDVRTSNSAGTITVNATGANLSIASWTGGSNLAVAATSTGNLGVATNNGNITLNTTTVGGILNVISNKNILSGGSVTVTGAANLTAATGANVSFTGKAATIGVQGTGATALGDVVLTMTDAFAIGPVTAGNLTVSATKDLTQAAAPGAGVLTITNNTSLTSTGGNVTLTENITTGGNLVVTAANNVSHTAGALSVGGTATFTATGGNLTLGALNAGGPDHVTGTAGKKVTLGGVISVGNATVGNATFTAGTDLAVNGDLTALNVSLTGGNITDTAIITAGTLRVAGSNDVKLDSANALANLLVTGAAGNVVINDVGGVTITNGTNVSGNLTVSSTGAVALGAQATDSITVGKKLTLTGVGITDETDMINTGDLDITSTGAVVINGGTGAVPANLKSSFGAVNVSAATQAVTVFEGAALNLGNITAASLTAYSPVGIINSGKLAVGTVLVGAGTAAAPADIVLNNKTNAITGTIGILTDLAINPGATGHYLVRDFTLVNADSAGVFSVAKNLYNVGLTGNISLSAVGSANLNVGELVTTGPVTLSSETGYIDADHANNTFTTVNVISGSTSGTASSIASSQALTVNATLGNATVAGGGATGAFNFATGGTNKDLTIGQFRSYGTGTVAFNASGNVADSAAGLHIYGGTSVTADNITLTSGGNFGQLTLNTLAGNGTVTIVESGTLNLLSVKTGTGAFSATSQTGGIIEAGGTGVIETTGPVTLQANAGAITLNGTNKIGNIALSAMGNSTVHNTTATILGVTNVTGGGLTVVQSTATDITQRAATAINISGAGSFTTTGTGNITLANSGNQFGPVTAVTGSGNIALTEGSTLNLKGVTTTGNLVAISTAGGIIDSGTLTVVGNATFHAPAGSVILDEAASNFGVVVFGNATTAVAGNVALTDAVGVTLGSANIGGTLSVTATSGNIGQVDALKVFGDVSLTTDLTNATRIELNHADNEFGGVKFNVGHGGASLREKGTFVLLPGSSSAAALAGPASAVTIVTGGDFVTATGGRSTFNGDLTINAVGTIIPTAGSLLVAGTFTVISQNTVNLSALIKSVDLSGKDPVHTAVPADKYTPPTP